MSIKLTAIRNHNYKTLEDFVDIHKGERVFVIGNGPSLNQTDMSKMKDEITIGSNRCYLGYDKWGYNFKYWAIEDVRVCRDTAEEWNSIDHETKFIPFDLENTVTNWDNICLVNFKREGGWRTVDGGKVFYPIFSTNHKVLRFGYTVTYMMLQIAYIMGCDPIYLVGVDHYYSRTEDKKDGHNARFISTGEDPDHFDPNYFGKGRKYHKPRTDLSTLSYQSAENTSRRNGRRILNATKTTALDVFEKVEYDSLW